MDKGVLVISITQRRSVISKVQKIFTKEGCYIKTRLGIHDGVLDRCSDTGLIILELVGTKSKRKEIEKKLNSISGVSAKLVELKFSGKR